MMSFLQHRSKRWGYDGWALLMPGATKPLEWTASTTREEVRDLRKLRPDLFERGAKEVKVEIIVKVVEPAPAPAGNAYERMARDLADVSYSSAREAAGWEAVE